MAGSLGLSRAIWAGRWSRALGLSRPLRVSRRCWRPRWSRSVRIEGRLGPTGRLRPTRRLWPTRWLRAAGRIRMERRPRVMRSLRMNGVHRPGWPRVHRLGRSRPGHLGHLGRLRRRGRGQFRLHGPWWRRPLWPRNRRLLRDGRCRRLGHLRLVHRMVKNAVEFIPLSRINNRGRVSIHGGANERWLAAGRAS